ncbi:hypothetical protein [Acinetobacter portensis]|uniref:hypothetical protein n=1 Tax=Acinetobacter portensis TaxID=1839785 RepID=UPI0013D07F0A|nr:hypothetical protein [Acinetobacter portensis]
MKKMTLLVTVIFISMLLTACYTLDTWKKFPVNEKKETFHMIQEDQVAGFVKVIQKNEPTKFMVVGQNYAYLIENGSYQINELLLLSSKNKKLEIMTNSRDGLQLTVDPKQHKNYEFKSTLGFKFTIEQPTLQQKEILKTLSNKLKTKTYVVDKEQESYLITYIPIDGKIILLNDEMNAMKRENMSKSYLVKVGYFETEKSVSSSNLLFNILMTPISLVADAIIMPLASIAVIGDSVSP